MTDWISLAERQPDLGQTVLLVQLDGKLSVGSRRWWVDDDSDGDGIDNSSWVWVNQDGNTDDGMMDFDNPPTHWHALPDKPTKADRLLALNSLVAGLREQIIVQLDRLANRQNPGKHQPGLHPLLTEYRYLCAVVGKGLSRKSHK